MSKAAYEQNIVIDLEFTSTEGAEGLSDEVIQIGAVRVDADGRMLDEFVCNVQPSIASDVSRIVRKLTGISWSQLEGAPSFPEALELLKDWIGEGSSRIVAWSDSDKKQIEQECAAKGIDNLLGEYRWLDLQRIFPCVMGLGNRRRQMSLHRAFAWYERELPASCEHNALCDAQHTAQLLRSVILGEHIEQRKIRESVMRKPSSNARLSSKPMAGALSALYAQMTA